MGGGGERCGGGVVCHSKPSLTFTGPKTGGRESEREREVGGLRAVNSEYFKAVALYSCLDWQQIMHGT